MRVFNVFYFSNAFLRILFSQILPKLPCSDDKSSDVTKCSAILNGILLRVLDTTKNRHLRIDGTKTKLCICYCEYVINTQVQVYAV